MASDKNNGSGYGRELLQAKRYGERSGVFRPRGSDGVEMRMKERKLKLRSTKLKDGLYEVKGVVFYASSSVEAIRKYLRRNK